MIKTFNLYETIEELVNKSAQKVAVERGINSEEIHRRRVCRFMSAELVSQLLDNGIQAQTESRAHDAIDEHRYVVIKPGDQGDEREVLIDATWQQFLPEGTDTSNLPKALVGTREEVVYQAAAAGIAEGDLKIWKSADTTTLTRHLLPHEIVARAVDNRMSAPI